VVLRWGERKIDAHRRKLLKNKEVDPAWRNKRKKRGRGLDKR